MSSTVYVTVSTAPIFEYGFEDIWESLTDEGKGCIESDVYQSFRNAVECAVENIVDGDADIYVSFEDAEDMAASFSVSASIKGYESDEDDDDDGKGQLETQIEEAAYRVLSEVESFDIDFKDEWNVEENDDEDAAA